MEGCGNRWREEHLLLIATRFVSKAPWAAIAAAAGLQRARILWRRGPN
jgi:hypothetical protein